MATTTRFGLDEFTTPDYARLMPGHDPNAALMPRLWQVLQGAEMFKNLYKDLRGDEGEPLQVRAPEQQAASEKASNEMEGYTPGIADTDERENDIRSGMEESRMEGYTPDDDEKKASGYAKRMAEYASDSWNQLHDDADDQFANFDPMTATPDEIRKVQEAIGLTGKDVDGIWGRKSWGAFQDFKNKAGK